MRLEDAYVSPKPRYGRPILVNATGSPAGFTSGQGGDPPERALHALRRGGPQLGIEKIKTVGDAYMAVCGMPVPVPDHAERIVRMVSRMESGGVPHSIQVTRPVYEKLKDEFVLEPRGTIEVKGKGSIGAGLLTL